MPSRETTPSLPEASASIVDRQRVLEGTFAIYEGIRRAALANRAPSETRVDAPKKTPRGTS